MEYRQLFGLFLVLILTAALALSLVTGDGQPSVTYIGRSQMGGFFMAHNMTFPPESADWILYDLNTCNCQVACFTLGMSCQAWSHIERDNGTLECRIINKGPETTNLTEMEKATYFFKQSSVNGTYIWGEGNLLYVELRVTSYFQEAKDRCASIPGHRLVIAKSDATINFVSLYQDKAKTGKYVVGNIIKINTTSAQWGDGTIVSASHPKVVMNENSQTNFVFHAGNIHDTGEAINGPFVVLCQANPLGVEW